MAACGAWFQERKTAMNLPRLEKLNQFPPFLCYAHARVRSQRGVTRRLSLSELSSAAEMSESEFLRIACKPSWATVSNEDTERFSLACGVDIFGNLTQERRFFKRQMEREKPFDYLRDDGRLVRFNRIAIRWIAARQVGVK